MSVGRQRVVTCLHLRSRVEERQQACSSTDAPRIVTKSGTSRRMSARQKGVHQMIRIRRALWACAVMMVVPLQAPPVHAWPTIGLSPQELQAIIGRKMPVTHKVGQIDSPEVSLDAQQQTVEVCSKWQVWTPRGGGDVCGAGKPVWDRATCEVRLQTPRLTKGTLAGGGQLPGQITDLLNLLLGTAVKDLNVYKADALTCSLVKEIRVTSDRLEIHL